MDKATLCPCGSGEAFENCCGPYLNGEKLPPNAEALMRSRYTAYTRNDQAYVSRTWYPGTGLAQGIEAGASSEQLAWLGLEIKSCQAGGVDDNEGTVEFVAHYRVNDEMGQMHEISRFVKEEGAWFYVDGQFVEPPEAVTSIHKTGRNDPCFCGSGKKYKKCCGR